MKRKKQFIVSLALILLCALMALVLIAFRPELKKEAPEQQVTPVEVVVAERSDEQVIISAYGTVKGNREVTVQPEVGGRVIEQSENLVIGGHFKDKDLLLKIDPRDYLNAI